MKEILLVYDRSEEDAASQLEDELTRAFKKKGEAPAVTRAGNEENARSHLPGEFSLVITALNIRKGPTAPLAMGAEQGIELLRWMNFNQMNTPSILVAPTYTEKLRSAQPELGNCYVVLSGVNMVQDIVAHALQLAYAKPAKFLDVEIRLRSRTQWEYKLVGKGFAYDLGKYLAVDGPAIDDLDAFSSAIGSAPNWQDVLQRIGNKLMDMMSRERSFPYELGVGLSLAGGEDKACVRFVVGPESHSLMLEAVSCPHASDRYWMLSAPVYRRLQLNGATTGGFLFQGGQQTSCLIIDAATSGYFDDLKLYLGKLKSVSTECDWVQSLLNENRKKFNIGDVRLLRAKPGEAPLAQQVKEALESRDWGIVHFAGHSYEKNGSGCIFFPGAVEGSVDRVDLNRFSDWLRRATFTYFSSCDSGAGPFVFGLASRQASNILAFRWEIDDALAFEYAQEFYQRLFDGRSLERAFLKARQQMHGMHPDDRIWAAPILIKQLGDS
jgi:hypothetical protein